MSNKSNIERMEQVPLFGRKHRLTPAQKVFLRRLQVSESIHLFESAVAQRRTAVILAREGYAVLRVWMNLESQEPRTLDFMSFSRGSQTGRYGLAPSDARLIAISWKVEVQHA